MKYYFLIFLLIFIVCCDRYSMMQYDQWNQSQGNGDDFTGLPPGTPTADPGTYTYVPNGISLDGSGSTDPELDTLTYNWSATPSTNITFINNNTTSPNTTTINYSWPYDDEAVRIVSLTLMVSDGTNDSLPVSTTLRIYGNSFTYVEPGGSGDGSSPELPLGTIADGITAAGAGGKIAFREGDYLNNIQITFTQNQTLYGGYSNSDWTRDIFTNRTRLIDTRNTGGTVAVPLRFINFINTIDNSTKIDGFEIIGASADYSVAVYCDTSSSPIISSNEIYGGNCANTSYTIRNWNSSPIIYNNRIFGGNSSAIYTIYEYTSNSIIECNEIFAGSAGVISIGIFLLQNTNNTIRNNLIHGGDSDTTVGIRLINGSQSLIRNNTINGGYGATFSYGIHLMDVGSAVNIDNNIIFTGNGPQSYCIMEQYITGSNPSSFKNNDIFNALFLYRNDGIPSNYNDIASIQAYLGVIASGNISINPLFVNMGANFIGDWHLTAGSPINVRDGGIDGAPGGANWGYDYDKDDIIRTGDTVTGWSMGAYEID